MTTQTVDLYLRKSTKDAGRSVDRQLADLQEAAQAQDLTIGSTFCDPDFSASRYRRRDRPDFAALLEHLRSGNCQVLGLWEASRGSRDLTEWSSLLDLCRKRKIKIWVRTHDRVYDLSHRRDWRTLADEGVNAADESEQLSDRVCSGKRAAARAGRPAGRLQYGYTRQYDARGKLIAQVEHPAEAPIVREMVARIVKGDTLTVIAADLNRRGITMPGGSPWRGSLVRQLVLRPAYIGRRIHHGEDIGPATWPALVDAGQWQRMKVILTRPDRRSTTRGTALTHWMSNVALCGGCRRTRLTLNTGGTSGRLRYCCDYRAGCGKVFVAAAALEAAIEQAVLGRLDSPDALEVFRAKPDDAALRRAEDQVAQLQDRLDAHYAEAARGKLSARGISIIEGQLLPEIQRAEAEVDRLSAPVLPAELDAIDVAEKWSGYTPKIKRAWVRALAEVVVSPATRRGPVFDETRLDESRWRGDARTWGELAGDEVGS
jgi:site-specific DNA recombinase